MIQVPKDEVHPDGNYLIYTIENDNQYNQYLIWINNSLQSLFIWNSNTNVTECDVDIWGEDFETFIRIPDAEFFELESNDINSIIMEEL